MIPRFYCPQTAVRLAIGQIVSLPDDVARHALKALRLREGDALILFDGSGGEYMAVIVEAARHLRVRLEDWRAVECESPLPVSLIQALPSGDKMDLVIQKAVELGVAAVQPVQTRRSVMRLTGERAVKRLAHWRQVAVAACEQSGRNRIPVVHELLDLPAYLASQAAQQAASGSHQAAPLRLLLTPHQGQRLSALLSALPGAPEKPSAVHLLIGPEGGFETAEESLAQAAGFLAVRLGPRTLRTETAGLAALAAVMTLWGDF
ncbi:MAG: 16S rRNA (uracil(1498)-N(3))-methyltransferase [Sterolibacterium sp.]|nr:16S rRNA (uracil(1498)-N(3))-methyltransferase [Sterolibacterium sp.]